jgi:hypothetical protein
MLTVDLDVLPVIGEILVASRRCVLAPDTRTVNMNGSAVHLSQQQLRGGFIVGTARARYHHDHRTFADPNGLGDTANHPWNPFIKFAGNVVFVVSPLAEVRRREHHHGELVVFKRQMFSITYS